MARKSRKGTLETPAPRGMKLWRAALYIRLSVEFNGKRGDSLETQREIMEAYLALYPDIEIADVYIDNGISGRTFERDAFQRMLADIEAGKINCVVVKDLSRLGRSTSTPATTSRNTSRFIRCASSRSTISMTASTRTTAAATLQSR